MGTKIEVELSKDETALALGRLIVANMESMATRLSIVENQNRGLMEAHNRIEAQQKDLSVGLEILQAKGKGLYVPTLGDSAKPRRKYTRRKKATRKKVSR
jgi:hypothetical protein